ncbi:MAG: SCO family protein, partial [Pseudonocardiaceae bacterium]
LGADARSALPMLEALHKDPEVVSAPARATLEAILAGLSDADVHCCAASSGPDMTAGSPLRINPAASPISFIPFDLSCAAGHTHGEGRNLAVPAGVEMEDQDGRTLTFGDFFSGRPSIVAFFYTRCDNPNKCALTITKLARLQRALQEEVSQSLVQTAAITYDPDFDLPPRLRAYGENRGVVFGDNDRFLRTKAGLEALQEYFELGVNFGQALLNRHRIELFILDHEGRIAVTFARLQWDIQDVLHHARTLGESAAPAIFSRFVNNERSQEKGSPMR